MGIINVNDDSFSGDGTLNIDDAIAMAIKIVEEGADIIDVGAESARTNREVISVCEEVRRFSEFILRWDEVVKKSKPRDETQVFPPVLSLNTWRPDVIEQVLPLGGDILNDMSALAEARNAKLASKHDVVLLIMHSVGLPKVAHTHLQWSDIIVEMTDFFKEKIALALANGVDKSAILLDPGIDFAKQKNDNLKVYNQLEVFQKFECPILLPVSRKTVVGDVLGVETPAQRDAGTMACIVNGVEKGVQCFRVHNVKAAFETIKVTHHLQ